MPLTLPFGQIPRHQNGHCTRSRENWSNGQSNFASHCAMLRMENFQMRSALTSVGGSPLLQQGGAGLQSSGTAFEHLLPFALIISRNLRPVGLTSALSVRVHGPRVAGHASRITAFLFGNKVTIEIVPTYRKQRRAANSNRNFFRGSRRRGENSRRGRGE
jgi:hypothetical protein